MGAPKTQTVGGGSATPTADAYNKMLQGQLGTGAPQQAIGNLLNGNTDPTKYQSAGMANLPSAPGFQNTSFNPLNNNLNLSSFNAPDGNQGVPGFQQLLGMGQSNLNPLASFSANAGGQQGNLQDIMNAGRVNYGANNIGMPNADVLSQRAQTIGGVVGTQNALDLANERQRFAAGGMGSQGTGAQLADTLQQTYGKQQLLQGLQGVTQQDIGNTLQYGQLNTQNQLAGQGLQQGDILGRLGLANTQQLGNYQIGNQASIANMQAMLQSAMGQSQLGLGGLQNALQGSVQGGQLGLQGLGMNANNMLNSANFNQAGTQQMNQNNFMQNSAMNQFMQQMFGQQSQNALGNQQLGNQFGLGSSQQGMQGMMAALQQLFGGFNGSNQIGTPQAQTVQVPNAWQTAISGINDVMGIAGNAVKMAHGMPPSAQQNGLGLSLNSGPGSQAPGGFNMNPGGTMFGNNIPVNPMQLQGMNPQVPQFGLPPGIMQYGNQMNQLGLTA